MFSVNPATGRRLRAYPQDGPAQIEKALSRASLAFRNWREVAFADRARLLRSVARVLRSRTDDYAGLITAEMGKPISQARAEIEKCALLCDYYARFGAGFLRDETPPGAPGNARVAFEPLGVLLAIMPWNFPFWQAFRAAVPALAAGNAFLLKHASNVPGCALATAEVFRAAGAPPGLVQVLMVPSSRIPAIIADSRVRAVTLTGSTEAGKRVAALAGAAMKKGVFELGGSDPYIVLADADLDHAAEICAQSRLINSGQSCVCAKRFIVVSSVRREFERKFAERLAARRVGDPRDPATEVGPLARGDLRDALHAQVKASVRAGARLILGGKPIAGRGFFYAPTLLTDVRRGQVAYDEELFGPVAALISVRDESAAIAAANDSVFGLGSAVFSRSRRRAEAVASRLEAGVVFINDFVRSDPALPFGGVKDSGHGRELGGFGIREFMNIKTICG
jgi:succinate-semialdehyde dehydrogenase / glutarate-semialdehyde dehydrogenase